MQLFAQYHFRAGRAALERYHDADALTHLEACLKVWPEDPEVLLLAARVARRLNTFEMSGQFLDRYRQVRGEDDALVLERALLRAQRGEVDAVQSFCQSLLQQDYPAAPLILEALAAGYVHTYRLAEAKLCLDLWRQRDPDNCQALSLRGLVYELEMAQQEAVATYRRIVELDPERDDARAHLAGNLLDLAQPAEALPHLEYLRGRQPDNPQILMDLARCQDLLGQQAEAERLLVDVCARFPQYAPALGELGKLVLRDGRVAEAEHWLRGACRLGPSDFQAHYQLSLCLKQAGKAAEARKLQEQLKEIEDDAKRLREIITTQMPRAPHDPALHYELGMIYFRSGMPQEALRWLESALKEDPRHAPTHRGLAGYYGQIGQRGRAARHLELARPASPDASETVIQKGPAP